LGPTVLQIKRSRSYQISGRAVGQNRELYQYLMDTFALSRLLDFSCILLIF
jgi:hypothetical protein